jgi:hypothetical protein
VEPSGDDEDRNGVDDAFEDFRDADQLNGSWNGGESQVPCTKRSLASQRAEVTRRLNSLYARVPLFVGRASACGRASQVAMVNNAIAVRRSLQALLDANFASNEVVCPRSVCARVRRDAIKVRMRRAAGQLARYARSAKLSAIAACKPVEVPGRVDNRPITADYQAALERAISRLPTSVSRCS